MFTTYKSDLVSFIFKKANVRDIKAIVKNIDNFIYKFILKKNIPADKIVIIKYKTCLNDK